MSWELIKSASCHCHIAPDKREYQVKVLDGFFKKKKKNVLYNSDVQAGGGCHPRLTFWLTFFKVVYYLYS